MKNALFLAVVTACFATSAVACDQGSSRSSGAGHSVSEYSRGMLSSRGSSESMGHAGSRLHDLAASRIAAHSMAVSRSAGTECTTEVHGNRSTTYCESVTRASGASLSGASMKAAVK